MFGGAWHQGRRCRGIRDRVDECHRSGRCWWHTGGIPKAKGEGIGWCMGLLNQRLRDRLARLRDERHVNVSAWARDVIAAALDREFPADLEAHRRDNPSPAGDPASSTTAGGAVLDGPDVAALAEDPRGTPDQHHRQTGQLLERPRSPRSSPATSSASSSATPAGRGCEHGVSRWLDDLSGWAVCSAARSRNDDHRLPFTFPLPPGGGGKRKRKRTAFPPCVSRSFTARFHWRKRW